MQINLAQRNLRQDDGTMSENSERNYNPQLTPLLRIVTVAEVLVLAAAGISLFFLPDFAREQWPWALTPFNTRFLGAVYIASMVPVAFMAVIGRWSPARPILWSVFIFTAVVLIISVVYRDQFAFTKAGTWAWFGLYIILPVNAAYHLWLYRKQPVSNAVNVPSAWSAILLVASLLLGLYGIGLLIAPATFSAFWPWKLDTFHSQLYSATFLAGAVGLYSVARCASLLEFTSAGVTQAMVGGLALVGLWLVDTAVKRVNWSETGTYLWIALFAGLLFTGSAMIWASVRANNSVS